MTHCHPIEVPAVVIAIDNLETDQIMPQQFLHGIDKTGLDRGLLARMLPPADLAALIAEAGSGEAPLTVRIDLQSTALRSEGRHFGFQLGGRHRRMLLEGTDWIGAMLARQREIDAFTERHWVRTPWLRDVARRTGPRLHGAGCD
jgi:3-isopropylmalate dehydratase small subunit